MRFWKTTLAVIGILAAISTYEKPWSKSPEGYSITDYVKEVGRVVDKEKDNLLIDCKGYYLHTKGKAKGEVYIGGTLAGISHNTDMFNYHKQMDELKGWNSARKPFDKPVYRIFNPKISKDKWIIYSCENKGLCSFGEFRFNKYKWVYTVKKGDCASSICEKFNEQDKGDFRRDVNEINVRDLYYNGKRVGNKIYPGQKVYISSMMSAHR